MNVESCPFLDVHVWGVESGQWEMAKAGVARASSGVGWDINLIPRRSGARGQRGSVFLQGDTVGQKRRAGQPSHSLIVSGSRRTWLTGRPTPRCRELLIDLHKRHFIHSFVERPSGVGVGVGIGVGVGVSPFRHRKRALCYSISFFSTSLMESGGRYGRLDTAPASRSA